ncbi:ribosomal-processing cysteine protease Prp [Anaerovibrio sp.]|uniref:ribosomal-processing cysteine protease Prp n=1 Tax=Anaerovibrio sp. TaxID=1872532 RepID=UPI0025ECBF5B|nr:ribosomal-processing cysteine protease Prp [Anaerovibrio sp.]
MIIVVGFFLVKRCRQRVNRGIEISVYRNKEGRMYGYSITGHHGEYGSDIVCAGVSVLAQTTLKGLGEHFMRLNNISEDTSEELSEYLKYKVAPGDLQVRLMGAPDNITDALLETMLIGLYDIYENCIQENDLDGVHIYEIQQDQEV